QADAGKQNDSSSEIASATKMKRIDTSKGKASNDDFANVPAPGSGDEQASTTPAGGDDSVTAAGADSTAVATTSTYDAGSMTTTVTSAPSPINVASRTLTMTVTLKHDGQD